MKYENHDEDSHHDILNNLAMISADSQAFPVKSTESLWEEDDAWMVSQALNARIDMEVECWGRRLA